MSNPFLPARTPLTCIAGGRCFDRDDALSEVERRARLLGVRVSAWPCDQAVLHPDAPWHVGRRLYATGRRAA